MSARLIDGSAEAARIRARVRDGVARMQFEHGMVPGLAVVLVGDDPASHIYVRTKARQAAEVGIHSFEHRLPATTSERELLNLLHHLNMREDIHGILVQLPLPEHISVDRVLRAIEPSKDVDGFHPENVGLLGLGRPGVVPCTPLGCLRLAQSVHDSLEGLEAVIVGRSTIVGRPAAQLFLHADCTITVAHHLSRDVAAICRRADVLLVAVGKAGLVKSDWIKPGATVIDVGINRLSSDDGKSRVVGDVDFESASGVAGAITPVPGGVGPMTVAVLLENTLQCATTQLARGAQEQEIA